MEQLLKTEYEFRNYSVHQAHTVKYFVSIVNDKPGIAKIQRYCFLWLMLLIYVETEN